MPSKPMKAEDRALEAYDRVRTTKEAIEYGATIRPLTGIVAGTCFNPDLLLIRVKGNKRVERWHKSFWEPIPIKVQREDLWGDKPSS